MPTATAPLTPSQIRAALTALGASVAAIDRAVRLNTATPGRPTARATPGRLEALPASFAHAATFVLPWEACSTDNNRKGVACAADREKREKYTRAKRLAVHTLQAQRWHPHAIPLAAATVLYTHPLTLVAVVSFPDARRRDAGNLRKLATDALTDAQIIADDALILAEQWVTAGIDRANPRLELILQPITDEYLTADRRGLSGLATDRLTAACAAFLPR